MRKIIIFMLVVIGLLAGQGLANVTLEVFAYENSLNGGIGTPLPTGIFLEAGDILTVSVAEDDMWSAGTGERISNANGLYNFDEYVYGGLSARFGSLVGQIGSGAYFFIGTDYDEMVTDSGELKMLYWDSNQGDNTGSVMALTANISSSAGQVIPAPGALLLGSMGMGIVGWLRRRRAL